MLFTELFSSCLWLLLRLRSPWYGDGCLTQNSVFSITFFTQRSTGSLITAIAVYAIAVIGVWSIIGYNMVLFLSGLQEIPRDYYEAASIDGATGVKQFFHITIPLLSPTIFFVMVTRVIGAMQVFDLIFMVMDRNSPALYKTQSLVYLFYQNSFVQNNKGYGSTIVVLLLVVIMIMTVFQNIAQKKWVHYN